MEEVIIERKERKLVIPGEELGEGRAGRGAYYEDGKVFSKLVGLAENRDNLHFVIPLNGIYNPKRGDGIIGKVVDISFSKWIIDINSPYQATLALNEAVDEFVDLNKTDLSKFFNYNDLIFAEIFSMSRTKMIQLSMKDRKCRKLRGGRVVHVTSAKVPRIIGKNGSMVEMIKELTGTQIVVGQNGIVWVKGENEDVAIEAINVIDEKSHMQGLTDHVKTMLTEKMKNRSLVKHVHTEEDADNNKKHSEEEENSY
ncbi:MAG: KH domain-containing protein [Candidatus Aenigmarchaeota archaeon]|nr:KH domain-containing protein [Candidatus Aenigmarchaeota archaeon]